MPTAKPRIAITLPDDLYAAINALADELEKPASKVVAQLLQEMQPHIEGLTQLHRFGREGNKVAAKRALTNLVGDAMAKVIIEDRSPSSQVDLFGVKKKARK